MPNPPGATPFDNAPGAYPPPAPAPIAWSPEQRARLDHEWRQLQRNFAFHPSVKITPLQPPPCAEYQVELRVRTLHIRDDGILDYTPTARLNVWLPPGYPHEAPIVCPVEAVFHPNITMDGILISPPWDPTRTIAQLIQQIGAFLAFQTYDPANIWNAVAMDWVNANAAYLPTDPVANFAPTAGGEPHARICTHGEAMLGLVRGQLQHACEALASSENPPSPDELQALIDQVRQTTQVFFENDIPAPLRENARQLDQWAEAIPGATMTFESVRQHHLAAAAALQAAGKLAESRRVVLKELVSLDELVAVPPAADPRQALAQLPDVPKLQAFQAPFKLAISEAARRFAQAKSQLAGLTPPEPRTTVSDSPLLERTLAAQIERATRAVLEATEKSRSAVDTIAPTLDRARDELAALERVIGWREYENLHARSRELLDQVKAWGSAAVQAYFVENEGGVFGPFEFEQRLDLGDSSLAVRHTGRTSLEIFDLATGSKLASSNTGEATVPLKGADDGTTYATTFRATPRCEDVWMRLEQLTRQIGELVGRLTRPLDLPNSQSWAGAYFKVLADPLAVEAFIDETREGAQQREEAISDLKLLGRFKERLATQFLLERHSEMVPRFKRQVEQAQQQLEDANRKIAAIFARCERDLESNQPLIPPRLVKEYELQTDRRDEAQKIIDRMLRRFATAAAQIKPRLSNPRLYGSDRPPTPLLLEPLPPALLSRAELLSDFELSTVVSMLESELGERLRPAVPLKTEPLPIPETELEPPEPLPVDDQPPPVLADDEFPQHVAHEPPTGRI
jgi:ubiquitin-protein ligase